MGTRGGKRQLIVFALRSLGGHRPYTHGGVVPVVDVLLNYRAHCGVAR